MRAPVIIVHSEDVESAIGVRLVQTHGDFATFVHVRTPGDAVELAQRIPCEIVLLDSAGDITQDLRLLECLRSAGFRGAVVAVLPSVTEDANARFLDAGCAAVLSKTNPDCVLLGTLRELLNGTQKSESANQIEVTERERSVLRFVCDGLSNKEIGATLAISESLVKATLQRLFSKLGVHTRSQLVRKAMQTPGALLSLMVGVYDYFEMCGAEFLLTPHLLFF